MRCKLLFIPLGLLLIPEWAAAQVTNILALRNLRQSVETTYHLKAAQADLVSTTQQSLQEDYHLGLDYAVYRARLLHGEIGLDLRADQNLYMGNERSTNDTYGFGVLYNITGIFLDRFPYPLSFSFTSDIADVPREFASSYQQKSNSLALHLPISSTFVPITFGYNRTSNETSGLELDSRSKSDSYTFGASHNYKNSETYFTIVGSTLDLTTDNDEPSQQSSNIDANLRNSLNFSTPSLNRILNTRAHVVTQRGVNESRTTDLGASLSWDLGRALETGTDYSFTMREEPTQIQRTHNARAWLQHRLFKSLTTRIEAEGNDRSLSAGSEQSGGGGLVLDYHKLLPHDSRMQLTAGRHYLVTANKLSDSGIDVFAETHAVDQLLVIPLNQQNVVEGSVKVWNQARTREYDPNLDYEVRQNGLTTEVVIRTGTSRIVVGDLVSIDYKVLVNSNITYSTTNDALGADFTFLENKYRVFANWNRTSQDLISGSADQINLAGSTSYRLGGDTRFDDDAGTLSVEYTRVVSSAEKSQTYKGAFMRSGSWMQGRYTMNLTDRYLIRESDLVSKGNSGGNTSNVFSASSSYSKMLENTALVTATGNLLNNTGYIDNTNLSLSLDVRWNVRKLTFNVNSQANFRYSGSGWTSDQTLMLRMARQF
ncbi:hypothetical protein [Geomonas ferrireducens]|uniref:hypothetical protein n=1 Tax=Geomonas ferrireducens TaxID=2570227 RepID=UPI0010A8A684|nr:hypothetical protein [Geomonas ferrireducens]